MQLCLYVSLIFYAGCSYGQKETTSIKDIDAKLARGQITISHILTDTKYMFLHTQIPFREIIKKYAKPGKVKIVSDGEPGKKISVKGIMKTGNGKPLNDALVYVYQTSDKGWYSDTAAHILRNEGDMRHSRLFGYLKTDTKGQFEFETIQPRGYPHSDLPAHIHIAVWKDGQPVHDVPGELLFDDDPRLTPERKSAALRDGYLVEKNSGSLEKPVYVYKIILK